MSSEGQIEYWKVDPEPLKPLGAFTGAVAKGFFDVRLMHLIFLRVSQVNGCAYCVDLHSRDALAAGETAQRVHCVATWPEATALFSEAERAVFAWAEALTYLGGSKPADLRAREECYAAVRAHYAEGQVVQIGYAVASINAWNRIAVGFNRGPAPRAQ